MSPSWSEQAGVSILGTDTTTSDTRAIIRWTGIDVRGAAGFGVSGHRLRGYTERAAALLERRFGRPATPAAEDA